MLAAAAGGSSQLGDVEALLPADPQQREPRQRALPSALSLHANWIESSDEEKAEVALVSHQPLKSLAMAAAAGPVGSCAAASPDCSEYPRMSPAHLIAPSRTTSHSLEIRTSWPAAEKVSASEAMVGRAGPILLLLLMTAADSCPLCSKPRTPATARKQPTTTPRPTLSVL